MHEMETFITMAKEDIKIRSLHNGVDYSMVLIIIIILVTMVI